MPNSTPSPEESDCYESVVMPLVTGKYHRAVVILQLEDGDVPAVYQMTEGVDESIDMVLSAQFQLHEARREPEE